MTADQIIDAIVQQSGTDASRTTVLSLLNEQYISMVVRSRWLLETVTVGTTVADQTDYSLADTVLDIVHLRVGGSLLEPISTEQLWRLQDGSASLVRSPGAYALTFSSSGGTSVSLYPAPDSTGDSIQALTPAAATALTDSSGAGGALITPADTHGSLIDGTTGLVLLRIDERPDLAQSFLARFEESIVRLRHRKNARSGQTIQALVAGYHW